MIPIADVTPTVPSPTPTCAMPTEEEISEEGFGYFRGTWFIGRVSVREAKATVDDEGGIIEWLDRVASDPVEYELLASAIEQSDANLLPTRLHATAVRDGLDKFIVGEDDFAPLDGLEIGVAGLTNALSAVRCLTAASCRWHISNRSWSDCPVVYFAAPHWRVEVLADLVSLTRCGLGQDRNLLFVYGASIQDTHRLAQHILRERGRFRRMPQRWKSGQRRATSRQEQLDLFSD